MVTKPPCSVSGCEKPAKTTGMCGMHYERLRRRGSVELTRIPEWERFWSRVDASGDCWEWTGRLSRGYGQFTRTGRNPRGAHRVAWELLVGPIPDGLEIDHLCRNHACVNPDHLEPVTPAENQRRAYGTAPQRQRAKTHCPKGHPYAGDNLYIRSDGRRGCKSCGLESSRRPPSESGATCRNCGGQLMTRRTSRSLCNACYKRWNRAGRPEQIPEPYESLGWPN